MRRLIYCAYYLKKTNFKNLNELLNFSHETTKRSKAAILVDAIKCSWKYNISFEDYFLFRFFEHKDDLYRQDWAGSGFMYEYQKKMNPPSVRSILSNKFLFLKAYENYVNRQWLKVNPKEADLDAIENVMKTSKNGRFVVKSSTGQAGQEVKVLDAKDFTPQELVGLMEVEGLDLLEEAVVQHPELARLAPDGLNTVRVITQLNANGDVDILACRMRLTSGKRLDNFHQGGFAVAVDTQTGVISSQGFYRDPRKKPITSHPSTQVELLEFQIPCWEKIITTCKSAALQHPENRTVGWDVAIWGGEKQGNVELIEGNHNWNYDIYQLPIQKGLKKKLLHYLNQDKGQ